MRDQLILLCIHKLMWIWQVVWMENRELLVENFFLGGRLVSWISKKHNCSSQSIVEEKYVEATNSYNQIILMN